MTDGRTWAAILCALAYVGSVGVVATKSEGLAALMLIPFSIPVVGLALGCGLFGWAGGQVVDHLEGKKPPRKVRGWIDIEGE